MSNGQWDEFIAGVREVLAAVAFGVPVPPVGDLLQVGALVVADHGVLDEVFAARDRMPPDDFEQNWRSEATWALMRHADDVWVRLEVNCRTPVRDLERLLMRRSAVAPVLELAASGRPLYVARESSISRAVSPAAVLSSALPVFQGRSVALDSLFT